MKLTVERPDREVVTLKQNSVDDIYLKIGDITVAVFDESGSKFIVYGKSLENFGIEVEVYETI